MINERHVIAWEYLRAAIERLPDPAAVERNVEAVEVAFTNVLSPPSTELVLEFRREWMEIDGVGQWVWTFDGDVAVDRDFMADTSDHRFLSEWLRSVLGPCCVHVRVVRVRGNVATVRLAVVPTVQPRAGVPGPPAVRAGHISRVELHRSTAE